MSPVTVTSPTGETTTGTQALSAQLFGSQTAPAAAAPAPASATQALTGATGGAAANPTGAAQAAAGADATKGGGPSQEQLIEVLKTLVDVLNKLVAALMAQLGNASGGGPGTPPDKTDGGGAPGQTPQQGHDHTPPAKVEQGMPAQVAAASGGATQQTPPKYQPPVQYTPPVKYEPPVKYDPPTQVGGESDPGQKLPTQGGGAVTQGGGGGGTYTIKDGDMWSSIAQKFGTTMDAIFDLNKMQDRININSGTTIRIP